jgi:hypothetical protein
MRVGQRVRTAISLPGIPSGTLGTVIEVDRVFVVVSFADGRQGYYARRQLTAEGCCQEGEGVSEEEMAPLGVADARVSRGSHLCLLPSSREAAVNTAARFVAAGVQNGELAVCVVPSGWSDYLRFCLSQLGIGSATDGQYLRVADPSEVYLSSLEFTASAQVQKVNDILAELVSQGAPPVRTCAYVQGRHRFPEWWEYEERVSPVVRNFGAVYHPAGPRSKVWSQAAAVHNYVLRDDGVVPGGLAGP